ncbi:hypothetical protein [Pseudomonas sp. Snoq117.2]|uniref:hypothetical protein n=1 Tax=Pseudomonas sp. Snoq117.2 TaxID=1500302 RepID=UPI0008AB40F7|nr:hypothetical protein [Pseudomonas sp. Snoq117.2]SEP47975.1 hypothetical protein SAMN02787149_1323 [Pseudomonas sp. Snoq117.2]
MGEAKRRGTYEQRVQQASDRAFKERTGISLGELEKLNDGFDEFEIGAKFSASIVDISFFKGMNDYAYSFLCEIKGRMQSIVNNSALIESASRAAPCHLWFLGDGAVGARCFIYGNSHHIGISIETALETLNMFSYMMSCPKFLKGLLSEGENDLEESNYFRHKMKSDWFTQFPSRKPCTAVRRIMARELAMDVISLMILHEIVHLWHGHNELVGMGITDEQKMALEFHADTTAILFYINDYRMTKSNFLGGMNRNKDDESRAGRVYFYPPERRLGCLFFASFCFFLNNRQAASSTHLSSDQRAINFFAMVSYVLNRLGHFPEWKFNFNRFANLVNGALRSAEEAWSFLVKNKDPSNLITNNLDNLGTGGDLIKIMQTVDELGEIAIGLGITAWEFDSEGRKL